MRTTKHCSNVSKQSARIIVPQRKSHQTRLDIRTLTITKKTPGDSCGGRAGRVCVIPRNKISLWSCSVDGLLMSA